MYIDGAWTSASDGQVFETVNPATMKVIAHLARGTREDAGRAVEAASRARATMARMTVSERARLLHRVSDVMQARREALARTLSEDQGKPYQAEALPEIDVAINGLREMADTAKFLESTGVSVADPNKRVWSIRQPRGVYAVVTPWNFPINIPLEYIGPGLAMGNTIAWVPAPTTTLCAIRLMECFVEAGTPPGALNLVTGMGPVVGNEIVKHPLTAAVGFTGSSRTGQHIAREAAGKPLLLELGGNGPTIVLDDADIERASAAIAVASFFNAGQICSATERILVGPKAHGPLLEGLVAAAGRRRMGNPMDPETTLGPLNNPDVAAKTDSHIADSLSKGAVVLCGGSRAADYGSPLFYRPTVIDQVRPEMEFNLEETFGPVAPVIRAGSDDELLEIANNSRYGLVASVWTANLKRAFFFGEHLRTGIVNVNESSAYWETNIPFGGMSGTQSGLGRLGGRHTLEAMSDLKTIVFDLS